MCGPEHFSPCGSVHSAEEKKKVIIFLKKLKIVDRRLIFSFDVATEENIIR